MLSACRSDHQCQLSNLAHLCNCRDGYNPSTGQPFGFVHNSLTFYKLVKIFKQSKSTLKKVKDPNLNQLEISLSEKIGLSVFIRNKKNNSGSILFEYKGLDQLNKIIDIVKANY